MALSSDQSHDAMHGAMDGMRFTSRYATDAFLECVSAGEVTEATLLLHFVQGKRVEAILQVGTDADRLNGR